MELIMQLTKTLATDDRNALSKMIMNLFDHWQLKTEEQLQLLGLSPKNRASLSKYRSGTPLANDRDKLERAAMLLGIHKSLRLLFPKNRDLAYSWMSRPNKAFGGVSPVQLITDHGMMGLYMVRSYLDRQRGL